MSNLEAIALVVGVDSNDIQQVQEWPGVILVVGKGVSTFVSYEDLEAAKELIQ